MNAPESFQNYPEITEEQLTAYESTLRSRLQSAKLEVEMLELQLKTAKTLRARLAHLAFYDKHGEWDWNVRQWWIGLVKSFDTPYEEYKNGGLGHPFELWNYRPPTGRPYAPADLTATLLESFRASCTNAWVSPSNFEKCRPNDKTIEAFQVQFDHLLEEKERLLGRGFLYNTKAVDWKSYDGHYDTGLIAGLRYRL